MTTTALAPLTVRDTMSLAVIIGASQRQEKVVYIRDGGLVESKGVARGLFADAEGSRGLSYDADVRTGFLRITLSSGFEAFYPITDLMQAEKLREFVIYDWS